MRRALLVALLLPLAALADDERPLFNLVSLSAQAEREVPNDLLAAVLAAEAEGADPAKLAREVNQKMQRALELARGERAVRARSGAYQTWPVSEKGRIVRWRVRQELRLESGDFAAATELIGKLQASLALAGLALTVSPEARRRAENALAAEAIAAFEERARVVRDAMKAKGYRVKELQVSGGEPPRPMMAQARSMAAETAPAVEPGMSRILITVSGTVQLQ
jgi:predicted secreted protein